MRKKLLQFSMIATILFFGACSNESEALLNESGRTLSFSASMPDETPSTRLALESDGKDIKLTWEIGDIIKFAYVQGSTKEQSTANVDSVSTNGKTAYFEIPMDANASGSFTLYGVYGGGAINITGTNPVVTLPTDAGSAGTLANIAERNDVMLYFKHTMNVGDPHTSVTFKHLGSLFSITVRDVTLIPSTIINVLAAARLVGVTPSNANWAFNTGTGEQSFDLVTETFITPVETTGNSISFTPAEASSTVWGWYPILPSQEWPALQLQLLAANDSVLSTSSNIKDARTPVAGKRYSFYAEWNSANGGSLDFTTPF